MADVVRATRSPDEDVRRLRTGGPRSIISLDDGPMLRLPSSLVVLLNLPDEDGQQPEEGHDGQKGGQTAKHETRSRQ